MENEGIAEYQDAAQLPGLYGAAGRAEKLKAIVEAGTWAASGHGWQAAKIVVLQDAAEIAELERMNAAVLGNPDGHPFYGAPVVCVVLTDPERYTCVEDGSLVMGT